MQSPDSFFTFAWRITAVHVITYFLAGILAMNLFDYENLFASNGLSGFMRPTDDPITGLGPTLQIIRGLIFALVLWPFRTVFLSGNNGWLRLWGLFAGLGILSTFGPAPGSVDGMIYTLVPISTQLKIIPELLFQSFLVSILLFNWYKYPKKAFNIIALILLIIIAFMSIAGYIFLSM